MVVIADCDGVWQGDALAYAECHPTADVLVAGSHLTPGGGVNDSGLEPPTQRIAGALDTGARGPDWQGIRDRCPRRPLHGFQVHTCTHGALTGGMQHAGAGLSRPPCAPPHHPQFQPTPH